MNRTVLPRLHTLSTPRDVRFASVQKERDVAAHAGRDARELRARERRAPELREQEERHGRVGASSAKPRAHGDPLLQTDPRPWSDFELFREAPRRPRDQVRISLRNGDPRARDLQAFRGFDLQPVGEIDRAEPRSDLVKAVGPPHADPQLAVDLGQRLGTEKHRRKLSAVSYQLSAPGQSTLSLLRWFARHEPQPKGVAAAEVFELDLPGPRGAFSGVGGRDRAFGASHFHGFEAAARDVEDPVDLILPRPAQQRVLAVHS